MSRIGNEPIDIPEGITVDVKSDNMVTVKGPLGELTQAISPDITVKVEDGAITFGRPTDQPHHRSLHGLSRSLVNNMIIGVKEGYETKQKLVGVGFRAEIDGQLLKLSLGFSHDIYMLLPAIVTAEVETKRNQPPILTLKSPDKQLVGQVAAKIRSLRKPEPYKGKGIKFVGERLRRKAGKAAATASS